MKLNYKLYKAFLNDDYEKIRKYLEKGADGTIFDNKLYKYAVSNDDIKLLRILLEYNTECILKDKEIINIACAYNSLDCLKCLCDIVNPLDYKNTAIYTMLKKRQLIS